LKGHEKTIKTPVLDEMAATGLRLENFYAGPCLFLPD
jgi:hypothetical protein